MTKIEQKIHKNQKNKLLKRIKDYLTLKKVQWFKDFYNMDLLFASKGKDFDIQKKQWIEELINCICSIAGLVVLYLLINKLGELNFENFNSEILYSIFVIPLLLSLTQYLDMFDSCFVSVKMEETCITVKRGLLYTKYDKLYLKDINNIELYRSILGKVFGYSHMNLYAMGGSVQLPYIKNTKNNFKLIQKIMKIIQENQIRRANEN